MGTLGLLKPIADGCDALSKSASPSINAIGINMVLALATIMMVWFGIQEAISSARGGPGFDIGEFLNFSMLIIFAYTFVKYFDTNIPGLSFSLTSFIRDGTNNLVDLISSDAQDQMFKSIGDALGNSGVVLAILKAPYFIMAFGFTQVMLAILSAAASFILAYGALGASIIGLLGPVFIPWMVFSKTEWLFTGWLKAYIGFEFYKVVAAATMSVLAQVYTRYQITLVDWTHPIQTIENLPLLITLVFACIFMIWKIPAMTASLFSGSTGGHDAEIGVVGAVITAVRFGII